MTGVLVAVVLPLEAFFSFSFPCTVAVGLVLLLEQSPFATKGVSYRLGYRDDNNCCRSPNDVLVQDLVQQQSRGRFFFVSRDSE